MKKLIVRGTEAWEARELSRQAELTDEGKQKCHCICFGAIPEGEARGEEFAGRQQVHDLPSAA